MPSERVTSPATRTVCLSKRPGSSRSALMLVTGRVEDLQPARSAMSEAAEDAERAGDLARDAHGLLVEAAGIVEERLDARDRQGRRLAAREERDERGGRGCRASG